eukprot:11814105-Alexandrium_andersonii.AAC.1
MLPTTRRPPARPRPPCAARLHRRPLPSAPAQLHPATRLCPGWPPAAAAAAAIAAAKMATRTAA